MSDPFEDDLERHYQHYAYLKGSRQDPPPWEEQPGSQTAPMMALTASTLEEMDRRVAPAAPEPQRAAQPRLTRMQERQAQRSRRRRYLIKLGIACAVVFVASFLLGVSHII